MSDPTHGRIDPDIQAAVEKMQPKNLAQRVAIENTLQRRRDDGLVVLGVEPDAAEMARWEPDIIEKPASYWSAPTTTYRIGWWTHEWWPTRRLLWSALTARHTIDTARPVTVRSPNGRKPYWQALWRRTRLIRRPHRPWQAETLVPGCSCNARRAFTADGAARRVKRLHARRMRTMPVEGAPVSGVKGTCWAALTEEERAACR